TDGMTRRFYKDGKDLAIYNDAFFLNPDAQGKGLGTKSLSSQVQAAKNAGVKKINTFALRNDARSDKSIGYKVWADLGYDSKLSKTVTDLWKNSNPLEAIRGIAPPKTIRELYERAGGRSFWHRRGETTKMSFSLRRGSKSLKALNGYLQGKGMNLIK